MNHHHHHFPPREGRPPRHGGKERSLAEISVTVWLTPENAVFSAKNGLLFLKLEDRELRVYLCRQFPFDLPLEYISVLDEHDAEIGMIRNVNIFSEQTEQILCEELRRRYYAPKITSIRSVKEKYGFSYWKATTEAGEISFVLQDTHRSILRVNDERVFFSDVDGNRYEIPALSELDEKSRRRLELYL